MKAYPSSNYLVLIILKDLDIDLVGVRQARAVGIEVKKAPVATTCHVYLILEFV